MKGGANKLAWIAGLTFNVICGTGPVIRTGIHVALKSVFGFVPRRRFRE